MQHLRPRIWSLNVEGFQVDALDFEFTVRRSLKAQQNTCEVRIYNLARDIRHALAQVSAGVVVELRAGYAGGAPGSGEPFASGPAGSTAPGGTGAAEPQAPTIFLGRVRDVYSTRDGADWITTITSGDGDGKDKPVRFALGPETKIEDVVKKTIRDMGVGVGNAIATIRNRGLAEGLGQVFKNGIVIDGSGDQELGRIFAGAGLEHSIQNGEVQVLEIGKPLGTLAILLTPETTLVSSPEVGRDDRGATVKARSFLSSDISPGRQVRIESDSVNATFRIETVAHTGATAGNDWYTDLEARPWT